MMDISADIPPANEEADVFQKPARKKKKNVPCRKRLKHKKRQKPTLSKPNPLVSLSTDRNILPAFLSSSRAWFCCRVLQNEGVASNDTVDSPNVSVLGSSVEHHDESSSSSIMSAALSISLPDVSGVSFVFNSTVFQSLLFCMLK